MVVTWAWHSHDMDLKDTHGLVMSTDTAWASKDQDMATKKHDTRTWHGHMSVTWTSHGHDMNMAWTWRDMDMVWIRHGCGMGMTWTWHSHDMVMTCAWQSTDMEMVWT